MIYSFWWFGGFGFGIWRSIYPEGPIWSIAIGPLTVLMRFDVMNFIRIARDRITTCPHQ
jgi:hypothetical protein